MTMPVRNIKSIALTLACLTVAGGVFYGLYGRTNAPQNLAGEVEPGAITGSLSKAANPVGPSGLPLPRFVSLKAERVNVRRGPSSDHAVAWVFQRKGMPVEITAEFENWRKIRDSEGQEGWILQSMLSGKRLALVATRTGETTLALRYEAANLAPLVAKLQPGVLGVVDRCDGQWCKITAGGYKGYVQQEMLWGVYPGENVR
jgi:SH3-like domain-containing protein